MKIKFMQFICLMKEIPELKRSFIFCYIIIVLQICFYMVCDLFYTTLLTAI